MLPGIFIALLLRLITAGDFEHILSVDVTGDMHFSDPMGNVYIVKDKTLKKFSPGHVQPANYSNPFLGNIHSIDISDPLRILIFYKDHNQVVWVDNFLSEIRSPVWLDRLGIDQVELVCSSSQGGFWTFNSLNNQLQYFNVELQLVHESPSLNMLTGPDIRPAFMREKSRFLYLNVPGTGILVFDRFGNYSKTLAVDVPSVFQITDRHIYYMDRGRLFSYDLRTAETAGIELPAGEWSKPPAGEPPEPPDEERSDLPAGERPDLPAGDRTDEPGSRRSGGPIPPGETSLIKAELQPGRLYLFTRQGYHVYKTDP